MTIFLTRAGRFLTLYEGFKLGSLGKAPSKSPEFRTAEKKITGFSTLNDSEVYWKEDYDKQWARLLKEPVPEGTEWDHELHLKMEPFLDEVRGAGVVVPKLRVTVTKDNKVVSLTLVVPKSLQFDTWDQADSWIKSQESKIRAKGLAGLPGFPDQWKRWVKPDPRLNRPYVKWLQELKREEIQWQEYVVPSLEKIFLRGKDLILDYIVPTLSQQEDKGVWVPYLLITSYVTKDKRATPLHFDGFKHKTMSFTTRKQGRDWIQKMKPDVQKFGLGGIEFPDDWTNLKSEN